MFTRYLNTLQSAVKRRDFIGFDIETWGHENRFLMLTMYSDDVRLAFHDREKFVRHLIDNAAFYRRKVFCAVNLGFDFFGVFGDDHVKDCDLVFRSSSLIIAKFCRILFIDVLNFCRMSVLQMGRFLGVPKLEQPLYISERRRPRADEIPAIEEYCMRDSEITYRMMVFMQKAINSFGGQLKDTIASTAVDIYRRAYMPKPIRQPSYWQIEEMRKGYYGGRTEAFKRGLIRDVNKLDYKSCYPSVMVKDYPDPNSMFICSYGRLPDMMKYEGISHVVMKSPPNLHIPLLPQRAHDGRLLFPVGMIKGWHSHVEIKKALSIGYRMIRIGKMYMFTRTFEPFRKYVEDLYAKRLALDIAGDKNMSYVIKLLLNSLYGKFAQRLDFDDVVHIDRFNIDRFRGEFEQIPNTDFLRVRGVRPYIPRFVNPILSIYTTAYSRLKLYEDFERIGLPNIYYCDTDSIFTQADVRTGKGLGDLDLENRIQEGCIIRPKVYFFTKADKIEVKVKGLRGAGAETCRMILDRKKIEQLRFVKFRTAIRSQDHHKDGRLSINQVLKTYRKIDLEDNKRLWSSKFSPDVLQESKAVVLQ